MNFANSFVRVLVAYVALTSATLVSAVPPGEMQTVDLRSFFHGDPPPPPKAPEPKHLALVSTATGISPDAEIEGFLRALADAIKARDAKAMLSRLSDKYVIDDLPVDKKAADFFCQAIEQIPGAAEIIIMAIEKKNDIRTARIEFRYNADNTKQKEFRFDPAGKLLWSNLFVLQRQRHGA